METPECTDLEERLRSLLKQLETETAILDRIVYKNMNQHRRCLYFRSLLTVRRDVNLFQTAGLGQILDALIPIIQGKKPAQNAFYKKRVKNKNPNGKYNYQERLLGVARLLSQMSEPIFQAAIQISFLLAKTFFFGFSVTILSLLARLRVLLQQILLDVVVVFNKVSSLSQKKHSVKLMEEGIEAFREFYPSNVQNLMLECRWEKDKFVLSEKTDHSSTKDEDVDPEPIPSLNQSIQYEILDLFNEDQGTEEPNLENNINSLPENLLPFDNASSPNQAVTFNNCSKNNASEAVCSFTSPFPKSQTETRKVAFVSVRKPTNCVTDDIGSNKKLRLASPAENVTKPQDPFLSILMAGSSNTNIF